MIVVAVLFQIRLFNFGGDIYGDPGAAGGFFHFVGVLVHSSDRQ